MKNVCDFCEFQKNRRPESWYCRKYGITLHVPRIYCVSNNPDRGKVQYKGIIKADQIRTEDDSE